MYLSSDASTSSGGRQPSASGAVGPRPTELPVAVIGAGPAGLTAAYELAGHRVPTVVFEASDEVGGISRTVQRDGWRFDIGGHRFFTKVAAVERFWHTILPDGDFLLRPRMSRIYYRGKLYDYPLKPWNALRNLGPVEAARCIGSYLAARVKPPADQSTFEGWVAARFGWRLYRTFFKTYTEKVWGVSATTIRADWAAQRIKNLSLGTAVLHALTRRRKDRKATDVTTLIGEFQYPKLGPGMMWEKTRDEVVRRGVSVRMNTPVTAIERRGDAAVAVRVTAPPAASGEPVTERIEVSSVISSMSLSQMIDAMCPPAPAAVRAAAASLRYRDFLTVALVVPTRYSFPDNWIYIHDPGVDVGRIQNFGSWSPHLVTDDHTCLGLEYFVNEGDELWSAADTDLIDRATRELSQLGLVPAGAVTAGYVVRQPKAYPVYDEHYQTHVDTIRSWLAETVRNVHPVGRNGMHRYNNADHSMLTAMLTVANLVGGAPVHDVWTVNVEQDYHEDRRNKERVAPEPAAGRSTFSGRDAPVLPLPS